MWRMFDKCGEMAPADATKVEGLEDMITAAQCRSARTLLSWSVGKLASAASVSENAIHDFELERQEFDAATGDAVQRAFEDVGVEFLAGDDVRLRADSSTLR